MFFRQVFFSEFKFRTPSTILGNRQVHQNTEVHIYKVTVYFLLWILESFNSDEAPLLIWGRDVNSINKNCGTKAISVLRFNEDHDRLIIRDSANVRRKEK